MIKPDYNNSIVNLSSSILKAFNANSLYSPLPELENLKKSTNIILLVIDGLGYEYLEKYGQGSTLKKYLVKKITSVFPSTTACALTALKTGVAPKQHGITGWFMLLKELGVVTTILPFHPRFGETSLNNDKIENKDIFIEPNISDKIKYSSFTIYPEKIAKKQINKNHQKFLSYKKQGQMFSQITQAVNSSNQRKYIYSYWDKFDFLCHQEGVASPKTKKHFDQLDKNLTTFIKTLVGTNTTLIITADHGLIDTPPAKIIHLEKHPELVTTLSLPLCGESRAAYCYIHPAKAKQFENYVKNKLNFCCDLYKSEYLVKNNFFGLYESHPKLLDRIGDYILLMKDNYAIKDRLLKEKEHHLIGHHGGVSPEEMYVPLIIIDKF